MRGFGNYSAMVISNAMITTIVCQPHALSLKSGPFTVVTLTVPAYWIKRLAKKATTLFPMAQIVKG